MHIKELDTLIAVAEKGSFLKAARDLYITPASVMNQMNKLESIAGAKLVERTNRGATLTAAGRSLYLDAKQMIEFSTAALEKVRRLSIAEQNVVRVGTSILRPCKRLIDLCSEMDDDALPFQIRIVPFDDDPVSLDAVTSSLGNQIDCIVSPCDSFKWQSQQSILLLGHISCHIALPRKHRLAKRETLSWEDLENEVLMLVQRGASPVLDKMRDDIMANHPQIRIADVSSFYDASIFNQCERMNCLMETLDIWEEVHPSLVTLPVNWEYQMPYGIIYAKSPSETVQNFVDVIRRYISNGG